MLTNKLNDLSFSREKSVKQCQAGEGGCVKWLLL